ncbi:alpha/beta hydrolase [Solimonas sp. SE-A11]|uniref:alpha/beta hydrolase n=1 Tax=Solimonas sp. SE-A11 TaxID=3054954 RepID=UPI00259C754D|nr:alpha/beta hydrolase [Solimonas sp. SE-A11]MDM4769880.1 alpha/beta hydrolase [Solimonas sp. SE-A11]
MLNPAPIAATGFPEPASHLSKEALRYFREMFSRQERDAMQFPAVEDIAGWQRRNREEMGKRESMNAGLLERYGAELQRIHMGGVPVADIRPARGAIPGKALLYVHGGGFVGGAACDALDSTLPLAEETGLRILSVDYTPAPEADHALIGEQVLAVLASLYAQGFSPGDVGIYGDSAGATIAASAMLRARLRGLPLPAALVLWSPWADLTCSGDSYRTLTDAEPFYKEAFLAIGARCYAGESTADDPLVSILFADYAPGYLPTLIQCGTRELLLSDAIRLHRRIQDSGVEAELDIYDGLWHVFQFKPIDSPEAIQARKRTGEFLLQRLGVA